MCTFIYKDEKIEAETYTANKWQGQNLNPDKFDSKFYACNHCTNQLLLHNKQLPNILSCNINSYLLLFMSHLVNGEVLLLWTKLNSSQLDSKSCARGQLGLAGLGEPYLDDSALLHMVPHPSLLQQGSEKDRKKLQVPFQSTCIKFASRLFGQCKSHDHAQSQCGRALQKGVDFGRCTNWGFLIQLAYHSHSSTLCYFYFAFQIVSIGYFRFQMNGKNAIKCSLVGLEGHKRI